MLPYVNQFWHKHLGSEPRTLRDWQERLFFMVFFSIGLLGLPALVASLRMAHEFDHRLQPVLFFAAYAVNLTILFVRRIPFRIRAWLGISFFIILGLSSLLTVGPVGSGRLWLLSGIIVCGLVLGFRAGIITMLGVCGVYAVVTYLLFAAKLNLSVSSPYTFTTWTVTTFTFFFLCAVSAFTSLVLVRGLDRLHAHAYRTNERLRSTAGQLTQEIEQHQMATAALRESEERFRIAFRISPDLICINHWYQGHYTEINESFTDFLGFEREEVVGRTPLDLGLWFRPEDRRQLIEGLKKSGQIMSLEVQFKTKSGTVKTGLMSARMLTLDGERHVMSIVKDITSHTHALEARQQLEGMLAQAQKMESLGTLAGGIAHDFNNILFPILGFTEMTLDEVEDNPVARQNLEEVIKSTNRARDLVRQILTFSRDSELDPKPLRLQSVVKESARLLRASIPTTIEIHFQVDDNCQPIIGDPTQIHQVIMNLTTNAYHAMVAKGGKMVIALKETAEPLQSLPPTPGCNHRYVCLTVSDTGVGIPQANFDRIFEPYFTTKDPDKGTGLGLAVVHGIVKSFGGEIEVFSEIGKGTTFNCFFPAATGYGQINGDTSDLPIPTGTERILVVDDEPSIVRLQKRMLSQLGYQVAGRTSSIEALAAFKSAPDSFDLVITDMTMPHLTGLALASQMLKIRPDLPIIICTGFSENVDEVQARAIGIRGYIMKPVVKRNLATEIRSVLAGDQGAQVDPEQLAESLETRSPEAEALDAEHCSRNRT